MTGSRGGATRTLIAAVVVIAGGSMACGNGSQPNAAPTAAATAPASATPTVPTTPTPAGSVTVAPGDPAVYNEALAEVQAYLDAWTADGQSLAAKQHIVPAQWPNGYELRLLSGAAVSYKPAHWVSSDEFTLIIDLNMHFPNGDGIAMGEGINTRFITFTRSPSGHPFLMSWATSP